MTGNVTGNVTGDVTGNVTGNVTGVSTGRCSQTAAASDGTSRQILFVSGSDTEYDAVEIDSESTQLSYVPSTNTFTVANIVGDLTGDVTGTATTSNTLQTHQPLLVLQPPVSSTSLMVEQGHCTEE